MKVFIGVSDFLMGAFAVYLACGDRLTEAMLIFIFLQLTRIERNLRGGEK